MAVGNASTAPRSEAFDAFLAAAIANRAVETQA